MKVLFLPNWQVHKIKEDTDNLQRPDKVVDGSPYWFFKYWPGEPEVDIIDIGSKGVLLTLQKKFLKLYIIQALRAVFKLKDYDLVISHCGQSGLPLALLTKLLRIKSPPHILIDIANLTGGKQRSAFWRGVTKWALTSIDGILYHASFHRENYDRYGIVEKKLFSVPFGVDTEQFKPAGDSSDYILSFGRSYRDYPLLLEAYGGLKDAPPLKIVGVSKNSLGALPSGVEVSEAVRIN